MAKSNGKRRIRSQRPVKGGRDPLPACVLGAIKRAVERDAARHNVSRSFVVAVILAAHYGIVEQEAL